MNDSTLSIIIVVLLIVLIASFFILNNYGYNVSLMEIIILFIIFAAIIGAWAENSGKSTKHKFTPRPKPHELSVHADPAKDFKFEDGKLPDFRKIDFTKYGIGGLDDQLRIIFRSGLYTRFLPKEKIKLAGIKHNKGIIMHGPPGTGKTTVARFLASFLNAKDVQIIRGPEIFNKYVGQSEENMRNIFSPAKKEYEEKGEDAGLYVIVFDEIDSVAPARGRSMSGVTDTVVNQFLTEMSGVDEYDNIIVIGTTNRLDMMDQGLLRSGRFDLKIKIDLPDEKARRSILDVHVKGYKNGGMFSNKIDLDELANVTVGYSGADIEALLKKALSHATERYFDQDAQGEIEIDGYDINKALQEIVPVTY